MKIRFIKYILLFFGLSLGIVCSFFFARFVDSSRELLERHTYDDEIQILTTQIFSTFRTASNNLALVDALSVVNVTNPEVFDIIVRNHVSELGVSRINLAKRVDPSLAEDFPNEISVLYNTEVDLIYITDMDIKGDLFVLEYVFPRFDEILGLVLNSEQNRASSLNTSVIFGENIFLDNIELADTGEFGRLGFLPILSSVQVNTVVNTVIRYNDIFKPLVEEFLSKFHKSEVEIHVDGNVVYDTNPFHDINNEKNKNISFDIIDIIVSDFRELRYSKVFIYMFFSAFSIVIVLIALILLNTSRLRAERYSSMKSKFIADISHEIRTPMNGIIGMAELLTELNLGPTSMYYVQTISSCGQTLMMLINDILDMAKIEAGLVDIRDDSINVQDVIKTIVNSVWETYKLKNKVDVMLEFKTGLPVNITGDEVRIQQVLHNLLTNSLKFTTKGFVKVVVSIVNEYYLHVSVQDTGMGMTLEGAKKAFKPFQQVHSRKDLGGTGLGLTICKQLCTIMGGEMTCSSTLGVGTTITFTVKINPPYELDTVAPPLQIFYTNTKEDLKLIETSQPLEVFRLLHPLENSTHPKILVVDDILVNRNVLSRLIKSIGVDADTCNDGLQAVQMCELCKYSLIFMDVVMPVMDGVEACIKIKSKPLNENTPIVFVSANVQSDVIERCNKAGGSNFVPKPVNKSKIVEMIHAHCSAEEKEYVRRFVWENL